MRVRTAAWLTLVTLALAAAGARADRYDDTLAKASALDAAGDLAAAADLLATLVPEYPEDFALILQLAWTEFRAARLEAAEGHYRLALAISDSSLPARLGLAWTAQRLGRCDEARPLFEQVLARSPAEAGALDGLKACPLVPAVVFTPALNLTGLNVQGSPTREWASSAAGSLRALLFDRYLVGATYRYNDFPDPGVVFGGTAQHELYLEAGLVWPLAAVSLRYAFIDDLGSSQGTSHHAGLTARYSPWGDGTLEVAASVYPDATILRTEPAWRIPLGSGFSVRPAAALQVSKTRTYGDGVLANGSLTFAWDGARGGVLLGGKYGEEFRPAYLGRDLVLNIPDRLSAGAWLGGRLELGAFSLSLTYEYDRMRNADHEPHPRRSAHVLALDLSTRL